MGVQMGRHVVHVDEWVDGHVGVLAGAVWVCRGHGHRQSCGHVGCMGGECVWAWGGMHGQSSWGVCTAGAPEPLNFETQLDMDYDEFHG